MRTQETVRLDLPAQHKYLSLVGACIAEMLSQVEGLDEPEILTYNVQLAVHEACTNVVDHAYTGQPSGGRLQVVLSLCAGPRRVVAELHDTGRVFDMAAVREPALGEAQEHGFGLFLMRQLMDEVNYFPQAGNNRWRLVKRL